MNGRNAIFRLFCLICLSLLMAACKKDDDGGNRSPIFDTDAAIANQMYTQNVEIAALTLPQATGGDGTLTYSLSPNLPTGLTFDDAQRTISGTPESGLPQATFTYTATDEDGDTAELTFAVSIDAVPAFADDAAITGQMYTQNVEIADLTLPQATGGDGTLTYTLSPSLPQGLTFDPAQRTLTGTPVAAQDATEYTYTAADEDSDEVSLTFTITVGSVLAFANGAMIADQAYTRNVMIPDLTLPQAMGGDGTLTYTLSPSLPQGLTFDPAQRTITGTPQSNMRKTTYTYTVTDEAGNTAALTFTLIVGTAPAFANDAAIAEQTYIQNEPIADLTLPQVTGGDGALTYTLSPALPRGLTFDATQRTITGTPEVMQTATEYTYTVTDEDGDDAALTFMLTVEEDLMPAFANDASVPPQLYTETKAIADLTLPQATGGNGDLTYTLTKSDDGSALPQGLTFDATMRVLAGRPATGTAAGATEYTLTATDRDGDPATLTFMITIVANEVPAFANDASVIPQIYTETKAIADLMLPEARRGNGDLTYTLTKSDGTALPAGLTFDGTMRRLAGRPATGTAASAADYTLTATDRDGDTDELTFSITIRAASATPITLSAATLSAGRRLGQQTVMLTSSVDWSVTDQGWLTTGTRTGTLTGSASATAQEITLTIVENGTGAVRMGTLTFMETTEGASPKFSVTLTVTQSGRVADGMIPINNLEQLNAMRYDLTGDGQVDHAGDQSDMTAAGTAYAAAFPYVQYAAGRYTGYMLARDLSFIEAGSYASGTVNTAWTGAGGGSGWLPVGPDRSNPFSGTFDGGGHAIDSLFINRGGARTGLFGQVTGTISNTGITRANVLGNRAGGLVGTLSRGIISDCYAANVTITANGTASYSGGLIGNQASGTISGCYVSDGTITGGSADSIGGLIGRLEGGTMTACYVNNSAVSGPGTPGVDSFPGSIVGSRSGGTITACYAGGRNYTNLISFGDGTITNCYYEIAADGTETAQAKRKATLIGTTSNTGIFASWNTSAWDFGTNMEYPILKGVGGTQR